MQNHKGRCRYDETFRSKNVLPVISDHFEYLKSFREGENDITAKVLKFVEHNMLVANHYQRWSAAQLSTAMDNAIKGINPIIDVTVIVRENPDIWRVNGGSVSLLRTITQRRWF
jgi:hypothetical protein